MNSITWDIGIIAAFAILLAFCLLIRRPKALAALVSIYIAYSMASIWGTRLAEFFAGDRVFLNQLWIKANATPFASQVAVLTLVTFTLSAFLKLGGRRARYAVPEVTIYTAATIALAVVFVLSFMTSTLREQVLNSSRLALLIYSWREWILVLPVLVMIFFGIYADED